MKDLRIPFRIRRIAHNVPQPFGDGHLISTLNQCGFFFCKKGEITVSLEGKIYLIRQHDIYIYMPSTLVRIIHINKEAEGVLVEADTDYTIPIVNRIVNTENLLHIRKYPCISLPDEQATRLEQQIEALQERLLYEEMNHLPSYHHLVAALLKSMGETLLYEVLNIYFTNQPITPLPQDKKDQVFQNFMLSLSRFYHKERDVAFYARLQHITPRYFSTLIREKSGNHASSWIIQKVITEAKQLLESSDLSIKEIAEQLHFPTQSFFGKYFKQYVGMSPKAYRKSQLKE